MKKMMILLLSSFKRDKKIVTVQTPPTIFGSAKQQSMGYATERGKIEGVSERLQKIWLA